jgi:hypothetical protein
LLLLTLLEKLVSCQDHGCTYNALLEIAYHELEEPDLVHIHVLPVVVLLPLPAPLTPHSTTSHLHLLLEHCQSQQTMMQQTLQQLEKEREKEERKKRVLAFAVIPDE